MRKYLRGRWLVNLVLLVAATVLLALALRDDEPPPPVTLASYFSVPIDEIRILRKGKEEIHFRLVDEYWRMLSPYQAQAEPRLIDAVLSLTTLPENTVAELKGIRPADFGLLEPATTIQFNQRRVRFGDNQPVGKQRYIELDGKVMLIPDRYMVNLQLGSVSYIDLRLVPQGTRLKSIRINGDDVDLAQSKAAWQSVKANWISLAADDWCPQETFVHIVLAGRDSDHQIRYAVEKRDTDVVLVNLRDKLEYHLSFIAYASLGIETSAAATKAPLSDQSTERR